MTPLKIKFLMLFLALQAGLLSAQEDIASFTLDEAIQYAQANHSEIRLERLNAADAAKQVKEYKSTGIPQVHGTGNWTHFIDIPTQILPDFTGSGAGLTALQFGLKNSVTAGVEVSALIFDGSFLVGLQAQRLYLELTQKQVNVKAHELKDRVTKAYLAALIAEKNIELLDDNIRSLEDLVRETRATYESGFAEKLDVDRLQLSLENLQTERNKVARLVEVSYNLVKFQMGYPVNKAIVLTNKFDEISSFEWNADWVAETPVDYTRRPENEVLRLAEELNTMNVRRLKAAYLPVFRGFFNYSEVLYRNNLFKDQIPWYPTTVTGLSLNVPIFDGLFRSSQIQRAQIDLQETQVQKAQFYEGMELQVRNARVNLQNAYETNRSRERSFALSQEIYRTAQIKFREGVGSSLELTQAESDMLTAQSNYIQSLYDMIVAKADLDQALGN